MSTVETTGSAADGVRLAVGFDDGGLDYEDGPRAQLTVDPRPLVDVWLDCRFDPGSHPASKVDVTR
ncbi:hypothetical protein [Pseudonocardia spinosispora]|uniref:hypothetical protein n=1 Tax=Pseudonocardia spinosispora TaxID=103441 RepID=UPI00040C3E44|nr:hypothetical protein [Pseudonocardia spinosispora]